MRIKYNVFEVQRGTLAINLSFIKSFFWKKIMRDKKRVFAFFSKNVELSAKIGLQEFKIFLFPTTFVSHFFQWQKIAKNRFKLMKMCPLFTPVPHLWIRVISPSLVMILPTIFHRWFTVTNFFCTICSMTILLLGLQRENA